MMTPEERIEVFLDGECPDQIPYTIYYNEFRHTKDDPAWLPMFEDGLRVTYLYCPVGSKANNLEVSHDTYNENGHRIDRTTMKTPVGEIYSTRKDGWHDQYLLKTAEDYRVMTYITEHTDIWAGDYSRYEEYKKEVAGHGVVHISLGSRTPYQRILVDYAGLENMAYHLIDFEDAVMEFYKALLKNFKKNVEIVAEGPGKYVSVLENFTAETTGPDRFNDFHMSVYKDCYPILHESGKIIGNHYDGKLSCCKELIAESPIDLIESLTPPPEGDMPLDECRQAWPDKLFWSNIQTTTYFFEPEKIRKIVLDSAQQASPDGKRLAFEVSELIPPNWKKSMPVVIEALKETRRIN
ncbi:hypothetical protein GF312_15920 [Candidatus Poribacteria bacterium]|nr:hypothetical protein [Candidatus Poribacteria bacterium]